MKYKLCDWEVNGYSDSDWYMAYWNSETNQVETTVTGTTRGGMDFDWSLYADPTPEVVEASIEWLAKKIKRLNMRNIIRNHYAPSQNTHLSVGETVVFKKPHHAKKHGIKFKAGDRVQVYRIMVDTFRTRPFSRVTWYTVCIREGNKMIYVPMEKFKKQGRPSLKPSAVMKRSREVARNCGFCGFFGGAWDSNNWALKTLRKAA